MKFKYLLPVSNVNYGLEKISPSGTTMSNTWQIFNRHYDERHHDGVETFLYLFTTALRLHVLCPPHSAGSLSSIDVCPGAPSSSCGRNLLVELLSNWLWARAIFPVFHQRSTMAKYDQALLKFANYSIYVLKSHIPTLATTPSKIVSSTRTDSFRRSSCATFFVRILRASNPRWSGEQEDTDVCVTAFPAQWANNSRMFASIWSNSVTRIRLHLQIDKHFFGSRWPVQYRRDMEQADAAMAPSRTVIWTRCIVGSNWPRMVISTASRLLLVQIHSWKQWHLVEPTYEQLWFVSTVARVLRKRRKLLDEDSADQR